MLMQIIFTAKSNGFCLVFASALEKN